MTDPNLAYDNPLIARYAGAEMAERWGPHRKFRTWRRLWLALAEAQHELGLPADDGVTPRIAPGDLAELRAHLDDIDFGRAAHHERRLRHDVMAHIETLGEVAPGAKPIVHLGATSCYVTDNADLILVRESLDALCVGLATVIGFEFIIRFVQPDLTGQFSAAQLEALHIHLCFSIPSAVLVPAMLYTGKRRYKQLHKVLAAGFVILWAGTVVTGVFFLPHSFDAP